MRDSERREEDVEEAEERFRTFAEQLPLVTYIDDPSPDGRSTYVSPQIEQLLGITAAEWVSDPTTFLRVIHPLDSERVLEQTRRCRIEGTPFSCEYRMLTASGDELWVQDAAVPVGEPTSPRYWQGYVIDITQRKAAEAQRERILDLEKEQNEELRRVDAMKEEFVALISHELRTPLTAIQGYLEIVRDGTSGPINEEQERMLAAVDRNSQRLLRLVTDILLVAQLNAGALTVAFRDVDAEAVAKDAIADANPRAAAAGVTLILRCDKTATIPADPLRLAQLFDNLISNAIKFTPREGHVEIILAQTESGLTIEVADSGIGMSSEDQERLFTPFFRTKAAASIQGTGLGLLIAKAIVEAHQGTIEVTSALGKGTRFTVRLPPAAQPPTAG